jgi:hypothetical protein
VVSAEPAGTTALVNERGALADRGGALSFPVVMAIFGVLLLFGVGLGVVIHRSYVGFERVAAHHVPPDTTLVVRWDVEKVSLFEPTRRFLLPLFDAARARSAANGANPPNGATATESRRERFARESGSMVSRDLREVVALLGPGEHDWALVLAGSFPKTDLVAALGRTFDAEGWSWRALGPGRLASPEGAALGRAADGALVIASSTERLDAVLIERPETPEVPRVGAGALHATSSGGGLPEGARTLFEVLGAPAAVDGRADWGSPLPVHLLLHFPGTAPADVKDRVRRALDLLLGGDLERIEHVTAPVIVQSAGNQSVAVTVLLDDVALEHGADRAARAVAGALGAGPAQDLAK